MIKLNRIGNNELFCVFTALLATSLFWSFYLISVSSIFLGILIAFEIELYPGLKIKIKPGIKTNWLDIFKQPLLLCVVLLFLLGMISYFWSDNMYYWFKYNQMRMQLLIIPFSILAHKDIVRNYFNWIIRCFVFAAFISAILVLYYYIKNHDLYIYALQYSKAIYTPVQHVRYTTLLVMAFGASLYLFREVYDKKEKFIYIIIAVFLFIILHLLAVKGSLVSLYLVCIILPFTLVSGKFLKSMRYALPLALAMFLVLCLIYIPSLNKKLEYVKFELEEYQQGRWQNLSDIERLISYKVGWEVAQKNPYLGTGLGDFEKETKQIYLTKWNLGISKLPHNEILFQFMSLGILGVLLLFDIYYFIMREKIFRTDFLCLSFIIPIFVLQLFNDTLESQTTVGMIAFILIVIWNRMRLVEEKNPKVELKQG